METPVLCSNPPTLNYLFSYLFLLDFGNIHCISSSNICWQRNLHVIFSILFPPFKPQQEEQGYLPPIICHYIMKSQRRLLNVCHYIYCMIAYHNRINPYLTLSITEKAQVFKKCFNVLHTSLNILPARLEESLLSMFWGPKSNPQCSKTKIKWNKTLSARLCPRFISRHHPMLNANNHKKVSLPTLSLWGIKFPFRPQDTSMSQMTNRAIKAGLCKSTLPGDIKKTY